MTTETVDPAIAMHADAVARAEIASQEAVDILRAAEARRATLGSRIVALDTRRKEIGARRAAGDVRLDDAGELALLAADKEAIEGIIAQTDAEVAAARAGAERAISALDRARHALDRAAMKAEEAALIGHADALATRLHETARALATLRPKLGGSAAKAWGPSDALLGELNAAAFYARAAS